MKVTVREEPAWKRILEIEVEAQVVERELDKVVDSYRRRLALPGFRKGKVPVEVARKHLGREDLEGEVLRQVLPQAFEDALKEHSLHPVGDPKISDLNFQPGQPLTFTATVEILPQVEVKGYEGLKLERRQAEIQDEQVSQVLDGLRDANADLEEVDRPAKDGDVVVVKLREADASGTPILGNEAQDMPITVGHPETPESFSAALQGAEKGHAKGVPLSYPADYPEKELAGSTRHFHITVEKVQEKVWPALDDAFASKVLGNEEATAQDLKTRVRLNLEVEARMNSMRELEGHLMDRLLELNDFELPQSMVESTLDRIAAQAKEENPNLPADEESRLREAYRPGIEKRYRADILVDAVGRQEEIEVSDEDLEEEIKSFAERENQKPVKVKAELKRENKLERLRDDLRRRRVIDKLIEKADVAVVEPAGVQGEETA